MPTPRPLRQPPHRPAPVTLDGLARALAVLALVYFAGHVAAWALR